MRTGRASVGSALLLALQSIPVFAGGTVLPPDPVGEKVYRAHLLHQMPVIAVMVVCILVAALLIHMAHRKRPPAVVGP